MVIRDRWSGCQLVRFLDCTGWVDRGRQLHVLKIISLILYWKTLDIPFVTKLNSTSKLELDKDIIFVKDNMGNCILLKLIGLVNMRF